MPQNSQIIPEYTHPYTKTVINDNTVTQDTVTSPDTGVGMIFVITSNKGRDRVLLPWKDTSLYLEEYGNPNFKQFGQPGYMPWAALSSGYAKAWVLRVTAANAAYSNLVVVAKVKVDNTVPATPKLKVVFKAMHHTAVVDDNTISDLTTLMVSETPDVDGYKTYPLFCISMQGRGAYGDAFRIRMVPSPTADKENGYKNYRMELYELENTLNRKEVPYTGTFAPDAIVNGVSQYFTDIVADSDVGSKKIKMYISDTGFQKVLDAYKGVNTTFAETVKTFDIFGGTSVIDGTPYSNYVIDTAVAGFADLTVTTGLPLAGGDDGAFKYDPTPAALATRQTAIDAAYINGWNGTYDPTIKSKRRTPANYILDAAYGDTVKTELIKTITYRYDAQGVIDGGILNTLTDAITWGNTMKNTGDRVFSKEFQHFNIKDPFSGKNIPMTMTYFLASVLPLHVKNNGNHIPFVGETIAKLTGAIKNSLKPVVDADDEDNKEKLYLLKLNYWQALAENVFVRGTQSTSQNITSDLSEENNMAVLLELKRKIETMVASLSYDFADKAERRRFTEDADRIIAPYRGIKLTSASVNFDMNAWETQRSILHCYLAVVFRTMAKRNIVEIDVNKR